jgi:hypothetical protein
MSVTKVVIGSFLRDKPSICFPTIPKAVVFISTAVFSSASSRWSHEIVVIHPPMSRANFSARDLVLFMSRISGTPASRSAIIIARDAPPAPKTTWCTSF